MSLTETKSNVPLLFPITVAVPAGTTRVISFPNEFLGVAVSIFIQNESGLGAATYQIGGQTQAAIQVPATSFRAIDDTQIKLISITADAGGQVIVQAQVQQLRGVETQ